MEPQPADAEVGAGRRLRGAPCGMLCHAAYWAWASCTACRVSMQTQRAPLRVLPARPPPRPCRSLILISEQIYGQLKQQIVASQMPDRQQHLAACLEKLMLVRGPTAGRNAGRRLRPRTRPALAHRACLFPPVPPCRTCSATWSPRTGTSSRRWVLPWWVLAWWVLAWCQARQAGDWPARRHPGVHG